MYFCKKKKKKEKINVCISLLDAMQVEVTRTYTARQPDELSLQVADVVLLSQTVDGEILILPFFTLKACLHQNDNSVQF